MTESGQEDSREYVYDPDDLDYFMDYFALDGEDGDYLFAVLQRGDFNGDDLILIADGEDCGFEISVRPDNARKFAHHLIRMATFIEEDTVAWGEAEKEFYATRGDDDDRR